MLLQKKGTLLKNSKVHKVSEETTDLLQQAAIIRSYTDIFM